MSEEDEKKIKSPHEQRNDRVKEHVAHLIKNVSFHGLSYVADKRNNYFRRAIWFLITVGAFIYAVEKVYESTVNYFSYPFKTARMKIYVNELNFPAVSFCNLNDFLFSKLNGTKLDESILYPDDPEKNNVSEIEISNITSDATIRLDQMLVDCEFEGKKCTHENFTDFWTMQGELCFTFNSGKNSHSLLKVSGVGVLRSLKLTINVQHYEYYRDEMAGGIHLMIHGQDEEPVKMQGQIVSPGYSFYVKVEKKTIMNLEKPYKTECGTVKLKYFDRYSMHTCWLEQLTDYVNKMCHCKDFFMPGNIPYCSLPELQNCTWIEWAKFNKDKMYKCPLPCKIDLYGVSLSRALFPTTQYSSILAEQFRKQPHVLSIVHNITDELLFMRDNLLRFIIYYDDLSYEVLEQKPSYETLVWLGDIGGQIGLFIGAGVMSYFEFLDCLAIVIYTRFFQKFTSS
ncbi:acid-sensing ion channel 1-like [Hydra vulgaris]|uniref:Acid-sensing ion channel 1-like n=1 Tax=Hydra vulgaris TaxID=6087 RepID=A0A0A0MP48_HYDVU|nr:acid-sensing ion channel 1-like [Hydra vulgaris]CDG50530.1 Hydra sodium channel 9 [Hydra vulgaris]